jgi:uncharacterized membrane protein YkvA (DUF1232 family)
MRRNPSKRRAFTALWRAARDSRRPGVPGVRDRIGAVPRMLAARARGDYTDLSPSRLGVIAFAALYIISPIDLAPELLLTVFGVADDALIAAWLTGAVFDEAERYLAWERQRARVIPGEVIDPEPSPSRRGRR